MRYDRRFRPKPRVRLQEQAVSAQSRIGQNAEHQLAPPQEEDVFSLSAQELRAQYGRRYDIYVQLVREGRGEHKELSEDELDNMRRWLQALNALDAYIESHKDPEGDVDTLRDQQFDVFQDIRQFLEAGETDGYVKLPTGFGKTVLFTELVEALNLRTLIVVPTKILVEQTEQKIAQFAADLDVGAVYSKSKDYGRQVTITTYDSLLSQLRSGRIRQDDFDCLVLDEVHMGLSDARQKTIQSFEDTIKIGFTATPRYSSRGVDSLLPTEIHSMDVREAVETGLLSSFSAIVAKTEVDLDGVRVTSGGEYEEADLARAVDTEARNQAALEMYQKNFEGESAIAYCVGITHAENVAQMFNDAGIPAAAISGKMSDAEREAILEDYRLGWIQVITNADLLIAGFDEPRASVCLNLRPTNSPVVAEQRAGRVLRLDPNRENKHAYVVDFVDKNSSKKQILFADIAGGAYQFSKEHRSTRGGGAGRVAPPIDVDIAGLTVVVDPEEVMRIVTDFREQNAQKREWSLLQLQSEVQAFGIKSRSQYNAMYKERGWPRNPDRKFPEWDNWYIFFGKEKKRVWAPLAELKQELDRLGIKDQDAYKEARKDHRDWPGAPHQVYPDWAGWPDFFSRESLGTTTPDALRKIEEREGFPSFSDFVKEIQRAGITSIQAYKEYRGKSYRFPSNPPRIYRDMWPGWPTVFGRKTRYESGTQLLSYDQLRAEVQAAGIHSKREYFAYRKGQGKTGWPRNPDRFFRDTWSGWKDLWEN
jgi:superfamily II DNA or RNA helicase